MYRNSNTKIKVMETIREQVKREIENYKYESLVRFLVKQHTSCTHQWLQVYPDGKICETEEADDYTSHYISYPDKEVACLYDIALSNACYCDCDTCKQYSDIDELDKEDFVYTWGEDIYEYCLHEPFEQGLIDECPAGWHLDMIKEMLETLNDIPYGYFDDEF